MGETSFVRKLFHALGNAEILPKGTGVSTTLHLREVAYDGVADSEIPEIDLAAALQFVAEVTTE